MSVNEAKTAILNNKTALGIEFGSTRIKAVLVDDKYNPIASGSYDWENRYENGVWTYSLDDIHKGLQGCYSDLVKDVKEKYDVELTSVGALGISAMMHGYMPFDKEGKLLVPFRTWRNNITGEASGKLMELFQYNIPQRWSIAHLYQAILNKESHVKDVDFFTTLAGYIHWQLTGKKVLGVGDASGMFPIDSTTGTYDEKMLGRFDELVAPEGFSWKLKNILPGVLSAGEDAGVLTEEGAKKLDVSGKLQAGTPICPPEGDAGTGMVATNSIAVRTGNVSAGTSVFAMIVLEKRLKKAYRQIDMVTTPVGDAVAMVHCNNCTSEINAWVDLFGEYSKLMGFEVTPEEIFDKLFKQALLAEKDGGGIVAYNYFSGEHVTGFEEGRPLLVRETNAKFNLANFMRVQLYTALGALKTGLDILFKEEKVEVDSIFGHGGYFTIKGVGQKILAGAINTPVSVMETAGEGGAWGIAILASYMVNKKDGQSLQDYLSKEVFANQNGEVVDPDPEDVKGFDEFIEKYTKCLAIERAAVDNLKNTR